MATVMELNQKGRNAVRAFLKSNLKITTSKVPETKVTDVVAYLDACLAHNVHPIYQLYGRYTKSGKTETFVLPDGCTKNYMFSTR